MSYTPSQIRSMVVSEAMRQGVDPALALAVAANESSFNPDATSRVGAQGVMQLMPKTAKWLGVEDPYDPAQNIWGGVSYLKRLISQFGDSRTAVAAYNFGEGNVSRGRQWPSETQVYVGRVMNSWNEYGGKYATPYPTLAPTPLEKSSWELPAWASTTDPGHPVWSVDVWGKPETAGISSSSILLVFLIGAGLLALTKR